MHLPGSWHLYVRYWTGVPPKPTTKSHIHKHFIHNLFEFLTNFLIDFKNFRDVYANILLFFFQNFNKYYSKLILFLIFAIFSRQFFSHLLIFYQFFCKFLKFFFKDLLRVSIKLQLKFAQIFILVYLKIFLRFSEVFLNFFDPQIIFLQKIVRNLFCLNLILWKTWAKNNFEY